MFLGIRRYTALEMNFNAVERVVEFMEMDQEAPAITDVRPPSLVDVFSFKYIRLIINS